jgi:hypothetical protein
MEFPHYQKRGEWDLLHGHPQLYLKSLLRNANKYSAFPAGRVAKSLSKFEFDAFIAGEGGPVPRSYGYIADGMVLRPGMAEKESLSAFLRELPYGHYFCKPDQGKWGVGAFHLEHFEDRLRMDGKDAGRDMLEATLSTTPYLIQEWIVPRQHPGMARFNPAVISSIRMVTFDTAPHPKLVAALFRSALISQSVDNWTSGGAAVAVDCATGALVGGGIAKHKEDPVAAHPVTGVTFDGAPIPLFAEATKLVEDLHARLRARTLGWDIALLDDGPMVLECNFPGWDLSMITAGLNPDLVGKFLPFHVSTAEQSYRFKFTGDFRDPDRVRQFLCRILARAFVSGRLESLSEREFVVTVTGSRFAFKALERCLRWPHFREQFDTMRAKQTTEHVPPGLDLSMSFRPGAETSVPEAHEV